ncbi:MAG: DUF4340 domain-containing protein [Clostridia bacterium]|nr:DUF4340 domain-containing protein [Clostridia bacterium]
MQNTPKRKKKNKALPLFVLVAILAVLAVAYFALSAANDKREAEEAAAAAADTTIMLAEQDYTAITELKYRTGGNDWITLNQSGGVWTLADDPKFPLNQSTAAGMGAAIASIGAIRTVEEGTAADYGLDAPACEIHVSYGAGTTYKYAIGDRNSFNNAYYFRNDDGAFYMIASGLLTYFQTDLADLIVLDTALATLTDADIVGFTVQDGDRTGEYRQTAEEVTAEDGSIGTVYSEDVTALYDLFCELDLFSWADYYADSAEMTEVYGIDQTRSLTLTYKKSVAVDAGTDAANGQTAGQTTKVDANYVLYFGKSGDGQTYYSPKGSTIVYTAADDVVNAILAYTAE